MPFAVWGVPVGDLHPRNDGRPSREPGWCVNLTNGIYDTFDEAQAQADLLNEVKANTYWHYSGREIREDEPEAPECVPQTWHEQLMGDE